MGTASVRKGHHPVSQLPQLKIGTASVRKGHHPVSQLPQLKIGTASVRKGHLMGGGSTQFHANWYTIPCHS